MRSLINLVCVTCLVSSGLAASPPGLEGELQRVIIPRLKCDRLSVARLLPALEKRVSRESRGSLNPHIALNLPARSKAYAVSLDLHGVPANEVIDRIANQTGLEVRYEKFRVVLEMAQGSMPAPVEANVKSADKKVVKRAVFDGPQIRDVSVDVSVVSGKEDKGELGERFFEEPILPLVEPAEEEALGVNLADIQLPDLNFQNVTFTEALRKVRSKVEASTGHTLEVRYHGSRESGETAGSERISMRIGKAPASEVIKALGQYAGYDVEFGEVIRFKPFEY